MVSWQIVFAVICVITAYGWAKEQSADLNNKASHLLTESGQGAPVHSITSQSDKTGAFKDDLKNPSIRKKRRVKRNAQAIKYPDTGTFLQLLELAKTISEREDPTGRGMAHKSLDSGEYLGPSGGRRSLNPRRGMWRRMPEEDYVDEPRRQKYDEPWSVKARSNPDDGPPERDEYQYWQNRQSRQIQEH